MEEVENTGAGRVGTGIKSIKIDLINQPRVLSICLILIMSPTNRFVYLSVDE